MESKKQGKFNFLKPFSTESNNILFALALLMLSQMIVSILSRPNLENTLRLQFMLKPDEVRQFVMTWSDQQWQGFWRHYRWDFVHPIIYGYCFMIIASSSYFNRARISVANGIIILASLFDLLENLFHLMGLRNKDDLVDAFIIVGGFFAMAKWSLLLALFLLFILNFKRQ